MMLPEDEALMKLADNDCYCELCNREAVPKLLRRIEALTKALTMARQPTVIQQLPKRVDEMTETEHEIFKVAAAAMGALKFVQEQAWDALAADAQAAKDMNK